MPNKSVARPANLQDGVYDASEVTPNDAADLPDGPARGIYVGVSGDVRVTFVGGTTLTIPGLAAGVWHPMQVERVLATDTTATGILAGY